MTRRGLLQSIGAALLAALLLAVLPRLPAQLVVQPGLLGPFLTQGETSHIRSFYGFNEAERADTTAFRWTNGLGNLVFRNAGRLGSPLVLQLRLCGCRAGELALRQAELRVNGVPLADLGDLATGGWRSYTLLVAPQPQPYSPDLLIEIVSDQARNPTFGYPIGVAVEQVALTPLVSPRAYPPAMAALLGLLLGGLLLLARWRGLSARGAGGFALGGLLLLAAQGVLYRPQALPAGLLALALALVLLLALLLGRHPALVAALTATGTAAVLAPQLLGVWMLDDAYISFRYAKNALLGHGLVFNPGERVEGYTNFLWTTLFVPVLGLHAAPALVSQALTLLLALAILALTWHGARQLAGPLPAAGGLALSVASPPFLLYTARGSGMETALFTALLLAAVVLVLGGLDATRRWRPLLAGLLLGLAAMTRPEGVLVAGLTGLFLLGSLRRPDWQTALCCGVGFLIIFGPYYAWRYGYYGYPLPNTFYAKVGGTTAQVQRGLAYAGAFGLSQAPLLVLAALGGLATLAGRRASAYLSLLVGCYSGYIVAVGGDHFPYARFFVPLLPLIALLAAVGLAQLGQRLPRIAAPALLAVLLVGLAWQAPQLYESRTLNTAGAVFSENTVVEKNREIGLWLRDHTPPDTLIATGIAGALPFYAERPVLDTLGLNDLYIAHLHVPTMGQGLAGAEKTDAAYILGRQPAYVPYNTSGVFFEHAEFAQRYRRITVHGPEGRWIRLYQRNDLPHPPADPALAAETVE